MANEGTKKAPENEKRPMHEVRVTKTRTSSSKEAISKIARNTKNKQDDEPYVDEGGFGKPPFILLGSQVLEEKG